MAIAERGPMRLYLAAIHLHRTRLFLREKKELKRARALIEQCGYWRRKQELEDAEEAATTWPGATSPVRERKQTMHKTVVELDLVGYSTICDNLEQGLDVNTAAQLDDQIQSFIDTGLKAVNASRDQSVTATNGDNAVLVFDSAQNAHLFAQAVHEATREHNRNRSRPLAKRVFRSGAATGEIVMQAKPGGGFKIAGTTIARAVRLEAKARPGSLLVDEATYAGLSTNQRSRYGAKALVPGKRDEEFEAYACQLNADAPMDADFFTAPKEGSLHPQSGPSVSPGATPVDHTTAPLVSNRPRRRAPALLLAIAALTGFGVWLWAALQDGEWQPVLNPTENSFALVRDAVAQDGLESRLDEFSVQKLAKEEFKYRWRQGSREKIYHVQRDERGVWNLSLVTAPGDPARPAAGKGSEAPANRTPADSRTQPAKPAQAATDTPEVDPRAVKLLNEFMTALLMEDDGKRLQAVLPLVHKSLRSRQGNDLDRSMDSSYKRAAQNAKFYQVPVQVTRVAPLNITAVGFGATAERGRVERYFVGKRQGVAGSSAPIHIFFPASGASPSVVNMGSL